NATFSRSIKIETIKPNRLKINLDFGLDRISFDRRALEPRLAVNWLTGIAGNDLKVETSVSYRPINTNFEGLANFEFDLPEKQVSAEKRVIFQGNTDEAGNTSFNYTLPQLKGAGGAVRAVFETKAFEPGGNFSVNTSGINYYPYQSFVGLRLPEGDSWGRLEQNVEHQLDVALVNGRGEALNSGKVRMKIYEVRWRWWWDEADDYSVNYMRSSNENLVSNQLIDIQNGKGIGKFKINEWGRYLMIVEDPVSGHAAGEYFYMSWREGEQSAMGATFLAINSKKEEFEVGDEVELTVPGAAGGQALVSIESGSKVVQQFWTKTTAGENIVRFQATPEMSPNVYAHVTLLQPHEQTSNDLPIRLYGIAPLKITDPKTILQPEIKVASELAPGKEVSIKISEKNRRPMVYTLAVVDEGLLDITNYKTPDAWSYFYSREAIGVKTWDIYDDVLGAYGGRLERVLAIGGDGEASLDDKDKKKPDDRFKPVVQFMGPFYSDGKATTHKFVMPQYIGSVKTMIVAGLDGAYGKAEATTPVIKPLMVLGTLPRVVGPGEKISLPVNVFKHKAYIKSATISVETKGTLKINGGNTAKIDLSDAETALQYFELEVAKTTGIGTVKITAKSGKEEAIHEVTLESRAPNTAQTQVKMITLEKGERFEEDLNTFGMKGTNTAMLEIARVPSMNLENRLQYLIRYPHGCIEQTVSAVFPQLFLDEITELSTPQKVKIEENIKAAITRLKKFQTAGGGLSYWPGQSEANSWGTNYGYHFLIEAEKQGFFVSKELKSGLKKAQELQAKYWNKGPGFNGDDLTQAYRLFTLALSGNASLGNMNRMRNVADLSSQAKWKLGAAYSLIGREQVAAELLNSAGDRPSNYPYWYSYGSSLRDKAILLETYTYLDKKGAGFKVLRELVAALRKDTWYSTQTTAYCLLAISKFLGQAPASSLKAAVEYGGKSEDWSSELPIVRASLNAEQKDQALSVSNETDGTLFITLTTSGTPYPGDEPATSAGLRLSMNYYNQGGEKINVSDIKKGQTFTANLRILNQTNDRVRDLALSQIFPSGWEINNDRLNDTNTFSNSSFDHQDIRDDRVYTYFDLERGGSKSFKISLTATYAGEYYLPGAYAEAMYDASISSKSQGSWIQVK
ncbi:MAG: alpha-2-macroglobulin family protein, partial [Bacteroidota bacterium]